MKNSPISQLFDVLSKAKYGTGPEERTSDCPSIEELRQMRLEFRAGRRSEQTELVADQPWCQGFFALNFEHEPPTTAELIHYLLDGDLFAYAMAKHIEFHLETAERIGQLAELMEDVVELEDASLVFTFDAVDLTAQLDFALAGNTASDDEPNFEPFKLAAKAGASDEPDDDDDDDERDAELPLTASSAKIEEITPERGGEAYPCQTPDLPVNAVLELEPNPVIKVTGQEPLSKLAGLTMQPVLGVRTPQGLRMLGLAQKTITLSANGSWEQDFHLGSELQGLVPGLDPRSVDLVLVLKKAS